MWNLVTSSLDLDHNSLYFYLMLTTHFRDTCVVAESNRSFMGFASGISLPQHPQTLFIWQVALSEAHRRQGLGFKLIDELIHRPLVAPVRFLQASISPNNQASWGLFEKIANSHHVELEIIGKYERSWFAPTDHEEEHVVRIGPFN